MKEQIRKIILKVVANLWSEAKIKNQEVEINIAPEKFGDYSANIALKLAGKVGKSPMEIAEIIKSEILGDKDDNQWFEKVEVVKPGFINFYFSEKVFEKTLDEIQKQGDKYGFSNVGKDKQVMVEFGQPNTHKAITVGHLKSAVSGLSIAKLFEALGHKVIKANYFGDVGMHVAKSTWGVMQKKIPADFEKWTSDERMEFIDEAYVEGAKVFEEDKKAEKEIRQINKDIYDKADNDNHEWYEKIRDWSIEHQNSVFERLGIQYDRQYPESEIYPEALEIVGRYKDKIFEESKGAVIYNGEKDGLNNWVFLTGEGNPTYSAKDLALAHKKFEEYDLDLSIVTTSVEQSDYFKAIIKVLEKIDKKFVGKYKHVPFGWLLMGGKKTSSRLGKTIKCMDVLKEAHELAENKIAVDKNYSLEEKQEIIEKVALGGLKFLILSHEFHKDINYDPDEFIKLNGFSGPFIMYSYVRINSIAKKVGKVGGDDLIEMRFEKLEEKKLASALAMYPDVVSRAGNEFAPHIVCNHLYEVASKFNAFYENCPIQKEEDLSVKKTRLILAESAGQVLKNGLNLLGIEILEKM